MLLSTLVTTAALSSGALAFTISLSLPDLKDLPDPLHRCRQVKCTAKVLKADQHDTKMLESDVFKQALSKELSGLALANKNGAGFAEGSLWHASRKGNKDAWAIDVKFYRAFDPTRYFPTADELKKVKGVHVEVDDCKVGDKVHC